MAGRIDAGGRGGPLSRAVVAQARAAILPDVRRMIEESIGRIAVRADGNLTAIGIRRALMFDPAATAVLDDPDHEQVIVPLGGGGGGGDWVHIETKTLTSSQATLDFTAIPQTYRHLKLIGQAKSDYGDGATVAMMLQANGDTDPDHYLYYYLASDTANTEYRWESGTDGGIYIGECAGPSNNGFGNVAFDLTLANYRSTTFGKTVNGQAVARTTASPEIRQISGWWDVLSAITSLQVYLGAVGPPNFVAGTVVSLYGVR